MKTFSFRAMGSKILIAIDTENTHVMDEVFKARDWFEEWEEALSRFRISSELSQFNHNAGMPVKVSKPFFEVAALAQKVSRKTNGMVSPLTLNALRSAGYTDSFDEIIKQTDIALNQLTPSFALGDQEMDLDPVNQTVTIPYGAQIDFGGFAKGWAAHQTMLRLQKYAPVMVDAGGDISVSGPLSNGEAWPIGIADPFNAEKDLELLSVTSGGIATSGRDYRRWIANNTLQHHIIDTRTQKPADTDVLTATVLANTVMDAEMNAKMGLILGSAEGVEWLNSQPDLQYYLVLEDGAIIHSPEFEMTIWSKLWNPIENNLSI